VDLEPSERELYDGMKKELLVELDGETIDAANAAVLSGKLLQMANGAIYNEERQVKVIHDQKLQELSELIEQANGQNVLVAYWYQHDHDRIREHLKEHASESTRRILADLPRQALRSGLENIHQELPRQARSGLDSLHHKHLTPERQAHLAQLPRQALRTGLDTLNSLRPARSAPQAEESQGSYPLLRGRWVENGKQPRDGEKGET
jgi:hypothetical protein